MRPERTPCRLQLRRLHLNRRLQQLSAANGMQRCDVTSGVAFLLIQMRSVMTADWSDS